MARNDQAVRLLVVLKQLEAARQGLTLEQLAESLAPGSTRHPRTLRRDLAALEEAGYPLVTERINGHTCWRLMEGFRNVPGLRFSPSELMALTFSRRLITPLGRYRTPHLLCSLP
jgi:predicted DNA-binding transcriptional regulator YafY